MCRIHSVIPLAMELVVNHALSRDPDQRFHHVGEFVEAFAQTCRGERSYTEPYHTSATSSTLNMPNKAVVNKSVPSVRKEYISVGPWQLLPPIGTGKVNAVSITGKQMNAAASHAASMEPELKVVALLARGSVAAVGVGVAVKMNLLHFTPSTTSSTSSEVNTTTTNGNGSQMGNMGNGSQMRGMGNGATPTQNTPQGHAGTVVGTTDLGTNASMGFLNPSDGKPSLLIHLPNGKFVAYERACTHQGVSVNYDPVTHKLVCPAHGAIFDPANSAAVLQGPATRSLALVTIRVNADGTITV